MEPLPPNMVAQTDMTRSTAKGSICTHFVPLFWLLVSYWQRSIDSGELPLGIALEFWFWVGCSYTFIHPRRHPKQWRCWKPEVAQLQSTEGKAGVPRFDEGTARLSEYAFRVRMAKLERNPWERTR